MRNADNFFYFPFFHSRLGYWKVRRAIVDQHSHAVLVTDKPRAHAVRGNRSGSENFIGATRDTFANDKSCSELELRFFSRFQAVPRIEE